MAVAATTPEKLPSTLDNTSCEAGRGRKRILGTLIVLSVVGLFWLAVGVVIARASEPLAVAKPGPVTERVVGTEYEVSATIAAEVNITVEQYVKAGEVCTTGIYVDGVEVGSVAQTAETSKLILAETVSELVGAGQKWKVANGGGCSAAERFVYSSSSLVTGGAGLEGKEGKEGREGKEGKSGLEGKEGKAGGTTSNEVMRFGPEATAELDGDTGVLEDCMWALVGTVIFAAAFFVLMGRVRV